MNTLIQATANIDHDVFYMGIFSVFVYFRSS